MHTLSLRLRREGLTFLKSCMRERADIMTLLFLYDLYPARSCSRSAVMANGQRAHSSRMAFNLGNTGQLYGRRLRLFFLIPSQSPSYPLSLKCTHTHLPHCNCFGGISFSDKVVHHSSQSWLNHLTVCARVCTCVCVCVCVRVYMFTDMPSTTLYTQNYQYNCTPQEELVHD